MNGEKNKIRWFAMLVMALSIPTFLALEAMQSNKFAKLEYDVEKLEDLQGDTIDNNKELITDLGFLASSSRIEKIAVEELEMHQATSDEIVRVEMSDSKID